jgi:hypothetical protein
MLNVYVNENLAISQIQKTAYKGTDFIRFSNPKFFLEIRIAYSDLYFSIKTLKLFTWFCLNLVK